MSPRKAYSKFSRPAEPAALPVITGRDLDLIAAILRYRFSPTSELVRLVAGNHRVSQDRLLRLYKAHLVNRFAFPGIPPSEFIYYLDNRAALELLAEHRGLTIIEPMLAELKNNRDKDYAGAAARGQHMQLGFLKHALMISRFHFMLEMACKTSAGEIQLEQWRQGAELAGHKVELPKVSAVRREASNDYTWVEHDNETVRLPVEPDALFTLRFPSRSHEQQLSHFLYEADRGTMVTTDMLKKMRTYWHFIKKQKKHKEAFDIHPVRAVLIETTEENRGKTLMVLVNHPLVAGPDTRVGLFWFTISPLFTGELGDDTEQSPAPAIARYLQRPEIIFSNEVWATPHGAKHSLTDAENSPAA